MMKSFLFYFRIFLEEIDFGEILSKLFPPYFLLSLAKNYLIENIPFESFFTRRIIFKIRRKQFLNYIENDIHIHPSHSLHFWQKIIEMTFQLLRNVPNSQEEHI